MTSEPACGRPAMLANKFFDVAVASGSATGTSAVGQGGFRAPPALPGKALGAAEHSCAASSYATPSSLAPAPYRRHAAFRVRGRAWFRMADNLGAYQTALQKRQE